MPKRLVVGSIRLARETKDVTTIINGQKVETKEAVAIEPKIGEVFDFTTEELDYLNEHAPRSIRHPRNDEEDRPSTLQVDPTTAQNTEGAQKVSDQKIADTKTGGKGKDASDL